MTKIVAETIHETGSTTGRRHIRDPQKKQERRSLLLWICVGVGISLLVHSILSAEDAGEAGPSRKLLESSECMSHPKWIEKGGVVLHFIGICYLFLGISIICDDFFVSSLEIISERLKLSADVAGATFMAAGSSAPELFTSLVALSNNHASNEIGVGTIVGSAVFNILVIIGVSAVFSGRTLSLDYRPIVRDCLFYVMAIAGVVGVFYDGKIYWWEGLISVFMYGVYIVTMSFNTTIMNMLSSRRSTVERFNTSGVDLESLRCELSETFTSNEEINYEREVDSNEAPMLPTTNGEASDISKTNLKQQDDQVGSSQITNQVDHAREGEDDKSPFSIPESKREQLFWLFSLPWSISFHYTVPDCSKQNLAKWYMVTFASSILWIGLISWFMVEWASDIGCILGVPSSIMGVTVLAAGTSIPDALSSISAAKDGLGDMAVANAVGSNVFDIWLGLGLPWLFVIPFTGEKSSYGMFIEVDNTELLPSGAILFGVLVFYLLSAIYTRWTLDKRHGQLFIALYLVYTLYYIIAVWAFGIYHSKENR